MRVSKLDRLGRKELARAAPPTSPTIVAFQDLTFSGCGMVATQRSYWPMGKPTRSSRADSRTTSLVGKVLESAMTADESGGCSPHPRPRALHLAAKQRSADVGELGLRGKHQRLVGPKVGG
jgi:hypothetical protein